MDVEIFNDLNKSIAKVVSGKDYPIFIGFAKIQWLMPIGFIQNHP